MYIALYFPYENEHRIIRSDGEVRTHRTIGKLYRDPDGNPVRLIGTVHDITDRKRVEEEIQKARKLESIGILAKPFTIEDLGEVLNKVLGEG